MKQALLFFFLTLLCAFEAFAQTPFDQIRIPSHLNHRQLEQVLRPHLRNLARHYRTSEAELSQRILTDRQLKADGNGRLYYSCEIPEAGLVVTAINQSTVGSSIVPLDQTFTLHSRPNAKRVIYLDFNGHTTSGTYWNTYYTNGANFTSPSFSQDADPTLSQAELIAIQGVWQRVAEDYAMYDIDVTTQEPLLESLRKTTTTDEYYGVRVVIGGSSNDWLKMGAGGIAYVGSFNWNTDTPVFVFPTELGNGYEKYVADALSHEVGHSLGLSHDGTLSGCGATLTDPCGYYEGHNGWAPIMGAGYYQPVVQWSRGEYNQANQLEDDLSVMINYGAIWLADDYGNTTGLSQFLEPASQIKINGLINQSTDVDVFSFMAGAGNLSIDLYAPTHDPNLLISVSLLDENLNVINQVNSTSIHGTSLDGDVSAGLYYLLVDGIASGNASTGFSDYASIGRYTLDLAMVMPNVANQAPTYAPTAFTSLVSCHTDPTLANVSLTWSDSNVNENGFEVWQSLNGASETLVATVNTLSAQLTIAANQSASYRVRAINAIGSSPFSTTSPAVAHRLPTSVLVLASSNTTATSTILNWNQISDETGFSLERSTSGGAWGALSNLAVDQISFSNTVLNSGTNYAYRIRATGACGYTGSYSNVVNISTLSAPPTPTNVTVQAQSANQINLNWADNSNLETNFEIQRSTVSNFSSFTSIVLNANVVSYSDVGLTAGTLYYYRLRASNAVGNSAFTATSSISTLQAVPNAPANLRLSYSRGTVTVSWQDLSNNEQGFRIERSTNQFATVQSTYTVRSNTVSYADKTNLVRGTTYYYRVMAYNAGGNSATTAVISILIP